MNGKQTKAIRKWCAASFEATPLHERGDLTLEVYTNRVKDFWKATPNFRVFMEESMRQHFLK
jgi:hypothetical protein